jgi:hypothetical protein
MKKAYVSGPYRGESEYEVKQNIRNAEAIAVALWQMGYAVFCPHMNAAFLGGACPDNVWLEGDIEWLKCADLVVLVNGWMSSKGTLEEIRVARECGILVCIYVEKIPDGIDWEIIEHDGLEREEGHGYLCQLPVR